MLLGLWFGLCCVCVCVVLLFGLVCCLVIVVCFVVVVCCRYLFGVFGVCLVSLWFVCCVFL